MKKIYLLTGLILGGISFANAQSPRTMLLEHFTQASCGPCATYNPAIEDMIKDPSNADKIIAIKYQTSWPGTDPMNVHNASEVQSRVSYYGVQSVPNSVVEGNLYNGHPADWGQDTIDNRSAIMSPFEMTMTHDFDEGLDSIRVHVKIKATQAVSGSALVLHMAIVEDTVTFATPPGSNGERVFYNVMKKMLPDANGTSIGSTFADGDSVDYYGAWAVANVYDMNELAGIAWVQNTSTKEVYQSVYSFKKPLSTFISNTEDAALKQVNDYPLSTCSGDYNTKVLVRNHGSSDLTSLDVSYSVNGGAAVTTGWTGNIATYETAEIEVPISYTPNGTDNVEITLSNPNNTTDGNTNNDNYSFSMDQADTYQNYVFLTFKADNFALQNSWKLVRTSDGQIIEQRERFSISPNETINKLFVLEDGECYDFIVEDSEGDGFAPGSFWRLKAGNGSFIISNGGDFQYTQAISFTADESIALTQDTTGWTGINTNDLSNVAIEVNPNPASDMVQITLPAGKINQVQITNMLGEVVLSESIQGGSVLNADLSTFENGVYFVRAIGSEGTITKKLIKN